MDEAPLTLVVIVTLAASLLSGVIASVVTGSLQSRRERVAWRRDAQLDAYGRLLLTFQNATTTVGMLGAEEQIAIVVGAMAAAREKAERETQDGGDDEIEGLEELEPQELPLPLPGHISDSLIAAREKADDAQDAFIEAMSVTLIVGTQDIVDTVKSMGATISEIRGLSNEGKTAPDDLRVAWLMDQSQWLRVQFIDAARKSLGYKDELTWPSSDASDTSAH